MPGEQVLTPFLARLKAHTPLNDVDQVAILGLPHSAGEFASGRAVQQEGDHSALTVVVLSGFAYRQKIMRDGRRQILTFHMRGDALALETAFRSSLEHDIVAATDLRVALIPTAALRDLAAASWSIARALWVEMLMDASVQREWTVNVGQRSARERIAHLLCELGLRMEGAGLADRKCFQLPFTQGRLADAVGLTSVHVNRILQALQGEGLIDRDKRVVRIPDWPRLADVAGFDEDYLRSAEYQFA